MAVSSTRSPLASKKQAVAGRRSYVDVLLPLAPPSLLRLAAVTRHVVTGDPARPESVDRMLLNFLGEPAPLAWLVLPLLAGSGVAGLLYVDRTRGPLNTEARDLADAVASTLGESLDALLQIYGRLI